MCYSTTHTHTRPHVVIPARVQDVRVFKRRNETQKKDNKKPRFMWLFRSNCFSITIYLSVCTKIKRKWLSIGQQWEEQQPKRKQINKYRCSEYLCLIMTLNITTINRFLMLCLMFSIRFFLQQRHWIVRVMIILLTQCQPSILLTVYCFILCTLIWLVKRLVDVLFVCLFDCWFFFCAFLLIALKTTVGMVKYKMMLVIWSGAIGFSHIIGKCLGFPNQIAALIENILKSSALHSCHITIRWIYQTHRMYAISDIDRCVRFESIPLKITASTTQQMPLVIWCSQSFTKHILKNINISTHIGRQMATTH